MRDSDFFCAYGDELDWRFFPCKGSGKPFREISKNCWACLQAVGLSLLEPFQTNVRPEYIYHQDLLASVMKKHKVHQHNHSRLNFLYYRLFIMGLTNFHSAPQLLERAGRDHELQAQIKEFNCAVYVNYTSFTQAHIDQYSWRLQYAHLDQWAALKDDFAQPITVTGAPPRLSVPKLSISPILKWRSASVDDYAPILDYIFIIEGNRGGNQKLVVQHDLHNAGATLFHEAFNGISVVFSGAVSKNSFGAFLTDPDYRRQKVAFKKAESVDEFMKMADVAYEDKPGPKPYEVLILC